MRDSRLDEISVKLLMLIFSRCAPRLALALEPRHQSTHRGLGFLAGPCLDELFGARAFRVSVQAYEIGAGDARVRSIAREGAASSFSHHPSVVATTSSSGATRSTSPISRAASGESSRPSTHMRSAL